MRSALTTAGTYLLPAAFERWVSTGPVMGQQLEPAHFSREVVPMPTLGPGQALVRVKLINIHSARVRGVVLVGEWVEWPTSCGAAKGRSWLASMITRTFERYLMAFISRPWTFVTRRPTKGRGVLR